MAEDVSDDKVQAALAAGEVPTPIVAPHYFATNTSIAFTSNACALTFLRATPANLKVGPDAVVQIGALEPVVILDLSPQSAKDLAIVLMDAVARHEKEYGDLTSDFIRKQARSGV